MIKAGSTSASQDSESGSSPQKDQQPVDRGWHRSADSGFVTCTENKKLDENNDVNLMDAPSIHVEPVKSDLLFEDTWNAKPEIEFNGIYETNDTVTIQDSHRSDNKENRKKWTFAKASDEVDSIVVGHAINKNIIISDDDDVNASSSKDFKVGRPVSLSDVPLPPLSMLENSIDWPMDPPAEFDDMHKDPPPSSPVSGAERKIAFKNFSKKHGMTNHNSTESEKLLQTTENCSKSNPDCSVMRNTLIRKAISTDSAKTVLVKNTPNGVISESETFF